MLRVKVQEVIRQHHLFSKGDRILVGVSGGVDSLALLDVLHQLSKEEGWLVFAGHLNHQFRGEEADLDADYVACFCQKKNIPYEIGVRDVPKLILKTHANPQAAARAARYEFFHQTAGKWNLNKIALAHHANDQAETILMRIFRGTGVEGLAGIPWVREENGLLIVRPFLSFYKRDLVGYCEQKGIKPREDSSNLKTNYHRNFLRLEVIPWLEEKVNPSLQESLNQLGEIAREESDYIDRDAREMLKKIMKSKEENKIVIKGKLFLESHLALQRRMIKLIFNYLLNQQKDIGFIHIHHLCEWIRNGRSAGMLEFPHGVFAWRENDLILISNEKPVKECTFHYRVPVRGTIYIPEIKACLTAEIEEDPDPSPSCQTGYVAIFDRDQLKGDLIVRSRIPGDRMTILGMNGTKKVKDIFIDSKIPVRYRNQIPIVCDDENILWIPGVKRSNHALVTPETKAGIILTIDRLITDISGGTDE